MKIITTTSRLVIREFNVDDAQSVYDFNAPKVVNLYTGDAGVCNNVENALSIINNIWLKEYATHGFARWAVALKDTGKVIGFCGFKQETRFVDIGYRLHPDYWGKGIATEANLACIEYAKQHLNLIEVFGDVMPENTASANVLKKLGMQYVARYQEEGLILDRYRLFLK
ncbi:GNAT family N-acetyltransferase [Shewanella maritima]|uniref:GNAT family N-acetyltransferase n=1 Tax=Shewanella maritima TaxID=2520507 RepID=UPI003736A8DF